MTTATSQDFWNRSADSSWARRSVVEHVRTVEPAALANHSFRSYCFATALSEHRGLRPGEDFDDDAVFFATVLHDLGLTQEGEARAGRFEVAGADLTAELLERLGVPGETIQTVWEAVALHTAPGIAPRRGIVCDLSEAGIALDFGRDSEFLSDEEAEVINSALPRLDVNQVLGGAILGQAERDRAKAPHLSTADWFYRSVHGFDLSFIQRWAAV